MITIHKGVYLSRKEKDAIEGLRLLESEINISATRHRETRAGKVYYNTTKKIGVTFDDAMILRTEEDPQYKFVAQLLICNWKNITR